MYEFTYNEILESLAIMRRRLRLLEKEDSVTDYYKGYSTNSSTLDKANDEIAQLSKEIEVL